MDHSVEIEQTKKIPFYAFISVGATALVASTAYYFRSMMPNFSSKSEFEKENRKPKQEQETANQTEEKPKEGKIQN